LRPGRPARVGRARGGGGRRRGAVSAEFPEDARRAEARAALAREKVVTTVWVASYLSVSVTARSRRGGLPVTAAGPRRRGRPAAAPDAPRATCTALRPFPDGTGSVASRGGSVSSRACCSAPRRRAPAEAP